MKALKAIIGIVAISVLCVLAGIVFNRVNASYEKLDKQEQKVLTEVDAYLQKCGGDKIWPGLNLEKKSFLLVDGKIGAAYLVNPQKKVGSIFAKKLEMPGTFKTAVYRISPMYGETLKYRFGGAFSTIGSTHRVLGNDVYFLRYEEENTGSDEYNSRHFVTHLAHESFHNYMQNEWPSYGRFDTSSLTADDLNKMQKQYLLLADIQKELKKKKRDNRVLKRLAKKYVKSVDERIHANKEYMKEELAEETAEGTAMYMGIKASEAAGYKYQLMMFRGKDGKNVELSFADIVPLIQDGKMDRSSIASDWVYQSGDLLCELMDAIKVPDWKGQLNKQGKEHPVTLYSILKQSLS